MIELRDFEQRQLTNANRVMAPVSPKLYAIVKKQRQPRERIWETVQRLLIAGINAEIAKENN